MNKTRRPSIDQRWDSALFAEKIERSPKTTPEQREAANYFAQYPGSRMRRMASRLVDISEMTGGLWVPGQDKDKAKQREITSAVRWFSMATNLNSIRHSRVSPIGELSVSNFVLATKDADLTFDIKQDRYGSEVLRTTKIETDKGVYTFLDHGIHEERATSFDVQPAILAPETLDVLDLPPSVAIDHSNNARSILYAATTELERITPARV